MERTEEEIMKMYNANEKYIGATINRRFGSSSYKIAHGLSNDDLHQYGRLGLYKACQSYDKSKGSSLRNHAIRCILGTILKESKKDSLGNINNKSNVLVNRTSIDATFTDSFGELSSLHDTIGSEEVGFNNLEIEHLLENLRVETSPDIEKIVRLRLEGRTLEEVGHVIGISKQAVGQTLRRNRNKIVRLLEIG